MNPESPIMINGLPGKMASAVVAAATASAAEYNLLSLSLTGPETVENRVLRSGREFRLVRVDDQADTAPLLEILDRRKRDFPELIAIDYSLPEAVHFNASLYARAGLPFVMGTTGGDRDQLIREMNAAGVHAVIAPNMAFPIVALQAMFRAAAQRFPAVFSAFELIIEESHQAGKVDTSGTARAMVRYFQELGCRIEDSDIIKVRDVDKQLQKGIPTVDLEAHAYHEYRLFSKECNMDINLTHNVRGRKVYAEGTLKAERFLRAKIKASEPPRVWDMVDVLEGSC